MQQISLKSMHIPVFGRIYGNLEGLFNTLSYLEEKTSVIYEQVLQLGDLGCFKDRERLQTEQAREPRLSSGVLQFLENPEQYTTLFREQNEQSRQLKLRWRITFAEGAHDDHDFLKQQRRLHPSSAFSIDTNRALFFLPTGEIYAYFLTRETEATVLALGFSPLENFAFYGKMPSYMPRQADIIVSYSNLQTTNEENALLERLIAQTKTKLYLHGGQPTLVSASIPAHALASMSANPHPYLTAADFFGIIAIDEARETYQFIKGEDVLSATS